jgi:Transposase DNA-binding/Transposase Tn5 dimerisation domain
MGIGILAPEEWAQRNFGQAQLGDQRRTRRATAYAAAAARAPSQSVPDQCKGVWKQTKGAYRLFSQPQVSLEKLQQPHRRLTLQAAAQAQVVLWLNDTTTLSLPHPATVGLGATGPDGGGQGMLLHTTLGIDVSGGIDPAPLVLGLGHQQSWVRQRIAGKGGGRKSPATKPKALRGPAAPSPESCKWSAGIEAVGTAPADVRYVHVGDAESDCWKAIDSCRTLGVGFAIRACQNRGMIPGHLAAGVKEGDADETTLLFDHMRQLPALGNKKIWMRSRPGREARWAQLAVSAAPITLLAPKNWGDKKHRKDLPRPAPIRCWAVRVYEINAPAAEEPAEWVILTDESVATAEAALKVASWYSRRWLIEEYHKCLKTGCRVEERQLEEAGRLEAIIGVLAVVAVRLLQLKEQAKVNPDIPAVRIVPDNYVRTLEAYLGRSKLTVREFWRETARLGGFLGRKSDGDPGWLTLWRGWQHLEILTHGVDLAKLIKSSG